MFAIYPCKKITHIYKSDFETFLIDSNSTYNLLKYQKKKKRLMKFKQNRPNKRSKRYMEFVTLVMINLMELFRRKWREC